MQILVIGSGGKEHAVIKALKRAPRWTPSTAAPGNGGIAADATCIPIKATDIEGVVALPRKRPSTWCLSPPTTRWCWGWWTPWRRRESGPLGRGKTPPSWRGAKVFPKPDEEIRHPTAAYETFDDPQKAIAYIENFNRYPIVIKADGLALGKGVLIAGSFGEAREAVKSIMEDKAFG